MTALSCGSLRDFLHLPLGQRCMYISCLLVLFNNGVGGLHVPKRPRAMIKKATNRREVRLV